MLMPSYPHIFHSRANKNPHDLDIFDGVEKPLRGGPEGGASTHRLALENLDKTSAV